MGTEDRHPYSIPSKVTDRTLWYAITLESYFLFLFTLSPFLLRYVMAVPECLE